MFTTPRFGAASLLVSLTFLSVTATPIAAQQRRYLLEVGAAGAYTSFDNQTNLDPAFGFVGRAAVWLPFRVSIEGEAGFASTSARTGQSWNAKEFSGSLLYNFGFGSASTAFLRAGYGVVSYDSDSCIGTPPRSLFGACGSSGALVGGIGARVGLSQTIMLRVEGFGTRSSAGGLTNFGGSAGLALMLGSKPLNDFDGDGVYDLDDDCQGTLAGALVDRHGCPTDGDKDGVADGLDRCPTTEAGVRVNDAGCPLDEDGDNVADGVDQCPATPAGAAVDEKGCPQDSDEDGVPDGLDRCPATPVGASVDQLGCPGDEDGDRVFDGLDRCPGTAPGAAVNAFGCPPGVSPTSASTFKVGDKIALRQVAFPAGSARLPASAEPALDSLARILIPLTQLRVEIAAHADGSAGETRYLTQLRAEAVRTYLVGKGVTVQRITAVGYGAAEPVVAGNTAAAQTANRRLELRILSVTQGQ